MSSTSTYGFRLRFFVYGPSLNTDEKYLEFTLGDGRTVRLASVRGGEEGTLRLAKDLSIRGGGFASHAEAQACGERLRDAIRKSSVELRTGFDMGNDVATSSCSKAIKESAAENGVALKDNIHGLVVYDEDHPVRFFVASGEGYVSRQPGEVLAEWRRQYELAPRIEDARERLAIDLYTVAHREPFPRAKFVTLVGVVEVLAVRTARSKEALALLDAMVKQAEASGLPAAEKQSLADNLRTLQAESIRSACRKYIEPVLGHDSWKEFDRLYGIRSTIVHDGHEGSGIDLNVEVATLDGLVCRLLAPLGISRGVP